MIYKILMMCILLVFSLNATANELTNNSGIVDIYYDHGIANIDVAAKDRYYVQPTFTAIPGLLSLKPREIQTTSCIETDGEESCPIDVQKCNVNVHYTNGIATPIYKTITREKSCQHGVYSDSLSKCVLPSKCAVGVGVVSRTTGAKECYSDYYTSSGQVNPQPTNSEDPYCENQDMVLNFEKTLCVEEKRCPNGYVDEGNNCKLNYHYYQYSCDTSSNGIQDKPIVEGEDCLGSCGQNGCGCNSSNPPQNNCKNVDGQCPFDASIPCVATPSENGEFEIGSSSYIYKPLIHRNVFGGFNSASINQNTGICEKEPCPYTVKHIVSDGPRLKFFEESSVEIPQYVEVSGNSFSGSIDGNISYIVVGDKHKTLRGYDENGNLLGVISSAYRINGKVGFIDSEGFNVVSTKIEDREPDALQNTLYFYNTFSDQYHKQGFLTFISEMDPSLADCTEGEQQIEQICALGSFNASGLCQKVMQNTFCYGSYELNSDDPSNPICKDTKQCVFGDYINKQDANTRLCSTYREIKESCQPGETLNAQGHCTYIQPKCRSDYEYIQGDNKCKKTLFSSALGCKNGYSMENIDASTNIGRCVADQACSEGTFSRDVNNTTKICVVDGYHEEKCPSGEVLFDKNGVSFCSYEKNVCASGYSYNSTLDRCEKILQEEPIHGCIDGRTFIDNGDGTGKCVENSHCTGGYWVKNLSNTQRKCYIDTTYNEVCASGNTLDVSGRCYYNQNKCFSPYNFSASSQSCERLISENVNNLCQDGYSYNSNIEDSFGKCVDDKICTNGEWVKNISSTQKICKVDRNYEEETPPEYSVNPQDGTFYKDKILCKEPGTVYNPQSGFCEKAQEYRCSDAAYTYNAISKKCEKQPICPSGMVLNSATNLCEKTITTTCGIEGYIWNSNTNRCEMSPSCNQGLVYNATTKKCELFEGANSIMHIGTVEDRSTAKDYYSGYPGNTYNVSTSRSYSEGYTSCLSNKYSEMADWIEKYYPGQGTIYISNPSNCNYDDTMTLLQSNSKRCKLVEKKRYTVNAGYSYSNGDKTCYSNQYAPMKGWFTANYAGVCVNVSNPSNCNYVGTMVEYDVVCDNLCPDGSAPQNGKCGKTVNYRYYEYNCPAPTVPTQDLSDPQYGGYTTYSKADPDENAINSDALASDVNSPTPPANLCQAIQDPICKANTDYNSIFDALNNTCYIPNNSLCDAGTYNPNTGKCEENADCGNSTYDTNNDVCSMNPVVVCSNNGGIAENVCYYPKNSCNGELYGFSSVINNDTLRCSESSASVCSSPKALFFGVSSVGRICRWDDNITETCSGDGVLNQTGRCTYVLNKCPSDYSYNRSSQVCEKTLKLSIISSCTTGFNFDDFDENSSVAKCVEKSICENSPSDTFVKNINSNTRQCLSREDSIELCEQGEHLNNQGYCVRDENLCDQRVGAGYSWEAHNQGSKKCEKVITTASSTSCRTDYAQEQGISDSGMIKCVKTDSCSNGVFNDKIDNTTLQCLVQTEEEEECPNGETLNASGECVYDENVCAVDYNYIASNQRCEKYIYESPATTCYKENYTFSDLQNSTARCTQNTGCNTGSFEKNLTYTTRLCTELTYHAEVCRENETMDDAGHCYYQMESANCPENYEQKLINNKIVCVEKEECVDEHGNRGRLIKKVNNNTRVCQFDGSYTQCVGDWNYENTEPYNMLLINNENIGVVAEAGEHTYTATTKRVTEEQCQNIAQRLHGTISQLGSLSEQVRENLKESILFKYNSANNFNEPYCKKGQYNINENACLFCAKGETYSDQKCLSCPTTDTMMFYDDFAGSLDGYSENRTLLRTETIPMNSKITFCRRYADGDNRGSAGWACVKGGEALTTDFVGDVDANDDLDYKITIDGIDDSKIHFCRRYADHNSRSNHGWNCVAGGRSLNTDFRGDVDKNDDLDYKITIDGIDNQDITFCRRYADYNGRYSAPWSCVHGGEELRTDFVGDVDKRDDLDYKIYVQKHTDIYSPFGCFHKPLKGYYFYNANIGSYKSKNIENGDMVFNAANTGIISDVECKSNINALSFNCSINEGKNLKVDALNNNLDQLMNISVFYLKNGNILKKTYKNVLGTLDVAQTDESNLSIVNFSIDLINTLIESNITIREPNKENAEFGKSYCVIENPKKIGFESTKNAKKEIAAPKYNYTCSPLTCAGHQCGIAKCSDGYNGLINDSSSEDDSLCKNDKCDINKPYAEKCGVSQGCPSDDQTIIEDNNGVCFKMNCNNDQGFELNTNEKTCDKLVCPEGYPTDNGDGTCSK